MASLEICLGEPLELKILATNVDLFVWQKASNSPFGFVNLNQLQNNVPNREADQLASNQWVREAVGVEDAGTYSCVLANRFTTFSVKSKHSLITNDLQGRRGQVCNNQCGGEE